MLCIESKDTEFISRNQPIDVKICQVVEGGRKMTQQNHAFSVCK